MSRPCLVLLALLVRADAIRRYSTNDVNVRDIRAILGGRDCLHGGERYAEGASVPVREPCLRCVCLAGGLDCVTTGVHCPGALKTTVGTRPEKRRPETSPAANGCTFAGTTYAAGSAMGSAVACEQCFCLRGERRCVRPSCLPPPSGCRARSAAGACCPPGYLCQHSTTDCYVEGRRVKEGERVAHEDACRQCFCLRGAVHCQAPGCAPALLGCRPLLRPGHCCPFHYQCPHHQELYTETSAPKDLMFLTNNTLISAKKRAFYTFKSDNIEIPSAPVTTLSTKQSGSTYNVNRSIDDTISNATPGADTANTESGTERRTTSEEVRTEQPEGTVKIVINGTINCTAELSSTSEPLDITGNASDAHASIPNIDRIDELQEELTFDPNDIITDRTVDAGFNNDDMFTINVTSSLRTNTSRPAAAPAAALAQDAPTTTKMTKDDYDYDYMDATLPPSLPNLKIIPFVAADAVVEEKGTPAPLYPALEREDKFPVYYPGPDASRRQDELHRVAGRLSGEPRLSGQPRLPDEPRLPGEPRLPAVNLFSPPVETEGGFVPKGPGQFYFRPISSSPASSPPASSSPASSSPASSSPASSSPASSPPASSPPASSPPTIAMRLDTATEETTASTSLSTSPAIIRITENINKDLNLQQIPKYIPTRTPIHVTSLTTQTAGIHVTGNNLTISPASVGPVTGDSAASGKADVPERTATSGETATSEETAMPDKTATSGKTAMYEETAMPENTATSSETATYDETATSEETATSGGAQSQTVFQEYDDEEEDDGFSFGSVLKLLLSDSYDTATTVRPKTTVAFKYIQSTTDVVTSSPTTQRPAPITQRPAPTTQRPAPTTQRPAPTTQRPAATTQKQVAATRGQLATTERTVFAPNTPPIPSFMPLPNIYPPSKKVASKNPYKIDHLVLGESQSIKSTSRPSSRPLLASGKPLASTSRPPESIPFGGAAGSELLKLAGCNIYGKMYSAGRVIKELTSPCRECRCTELGVQCRPPTC